MVECVVMSNLIQRSTTTHHYFRDDHSQIETDIDDPAEGTDNLQDIFINSLALFYLKLQAEYIIPASTIQMIIEEFQTVHDQGQNVLHAKLLSKFEFRRLKYSCYVTWFWASFRVVT